MGRTVAINQVSVVWKPAGDSDQTASGTNRIGETMSDQDQRYWEKRFVDAFVVNIRRPRYKTCLPMENDRWKVLDRLNHCNDFDPKLMTELKGGETQPDRLEEILVDMGASGDCWLMSASDALDGRHCPISEGASLVAGADNGTVMICPPRPVALYRPEASEMALYLLKPTKS